LKRGEVPSCLHSHRGRTDFKFPREPEGDHWLKVGGRTFGQNWGGVAWEFKIHGKRKGEQQTGGRYKKTIMPYKGGKTASKGRGSRGGKFETRKKSGGRYPRGAFDVATSGENERFGKRVWVKGTSSGEFFNGIRGGN